MLCLPQSTPHNSKLKNQQTSLKPRLVFSFLVHPVNVVSTPASSGNRLLRPFRPPPHGSGGGHTPSVLTVSSKPFTDRSPRKKGTQGRVTATSSGCGIAIAKKRTSGSEIYRSHHLRDHRSVIHGVLPALEIIPGCFVNR